MRYIFDDYILDTQRYELHRAGTRLHLRPKAFQVLAYLLAHRDRVVPKAELLEHVWPNQFIGDATLNSCIMAVRKALGDAGRTPRCLHTVHGQGYRFVAPVEERAPLPADTVPQATPSPAHALHFLASHEASAPMTWEVPPPIPGPAGDRALSEGTAPLARALDGEHKQVTVLCGALAEASTQDASLEPETLHHLMQAVVALVHATLQRYDGTLVHVFGEGFLALFGAPVAQEDHARRAVLAALELQQRLRQPDAVRGQPHGVVLRLGLHTGPVIIGHLAYNPQRLYPSGGPTIHLATQLQQQAAPGTLLVSATTYALVQTEVQGEACATLARDASSPPMPVYAVHGLTQRRAGVPWRCGRPLSRFVGREHELALLHARLAQAVGGQGQVIGIAGEPGMGKSRLLAEFAQCLHGQSMTYYAGHCLAYGSATPYLPVIELLRQRCGITDADCPADITTKIVQALWEVEIAAEDAAPVLLKLLDVPSAPPSPVPLSPSAFKARVFALLRQLSLHSGPQQLRILAVEDLHWIDPTSEEWLASLVEQMAGAALLLVVTYRPGYRPPWLVHSAATQLALTPLTPRESLAVVQAVPQAGQLPARLQQAIVTKAAGNPFFLEELAWVAADGGTPDAGQLVPDTIQAVLAMHMDRLLPVDKRILQTAAVIGKEVPVPLLQAVMALPEAALHTSLGRLQARECLYETRMVPTRAYTFKHALLQEVAYQSLLRSTRQQIHQGIAQVLVEHFPEAAETQPELLAHHYTEAGCAAQAVAYWQRAGYRTRQRMGDREAITHFRKGLDVLQTLPHTREWIQKEVSMLLELWVVLLNTHGLIAEAEPLLTRAHVLCEPLGDTPQLFWVLHRLMIFFRAREEHQMAHECTEQALALAQRLQDPALFSPAYQALGLTLLTLGALTAARDHFEHALAHYDARLDDFVWGLTVQALSHLACTLWLLGYPDQAVQRNHEALSLVQERPNPASHRTAVYNASTLHQLRREVHAVHAQTEAAIALASAEGASRFLPQMLHRRGWVLAMQGQYEEGIAQMSQALTTIRAAGDVGGEGPSALAQLAEAYGQSGRVEEGLSLLAEARAAVEQTGARFWEAEVQRLTGELLLRQAVPDEEQAAACFQQALDVARRQQSRSLELRAAMSLSRLWQRQGKHTKARELLLPLYHWFTEGFDTPDLQDARVLLEALA